MEKMIMETANPARPSFTLGNDPLSLSNISSNLDEVMKSVRVLSALEEVAKTTGDFVRLLPELSFMPALIGSDDRPVFVYRIVEGVDEYLDIDNILADFPTLSYSQVAGSIAFIKKVTQINSINIDVDNLEEEFQFNDPAFITALESAYNDKEVARVLSQPE